MTRREKFILESKHSCEHVYGMDPNSPPSLQVLLTEEELALRIQKYNCALSIIRKFMKKLLSFLSGSPTIVVTTDNDGHVLDAYGDASFKSMVDSLGVQIGVRFDESIAGTNSISLALKHKEPFELVGQDHYHHCFEEVACYSAPFFIDNGELIGTISLMTTKEYASKLHLGLLSSAIDTIEREVQVNWQNDQLHLYNQMLMSATPIGIIITNQEGQILEYNHSAENITAHNKHEMIGKNITLLTELEPFFEHVLRKQTSIENIELAFSTPEEKRCLLDILPLYTNNEQLIGAFAQFRDMTSYYQLQDQVIHSEKLSAIGKLGAGFAHEIRNPLTSIIGFTGMLEVDDTQTKYIDIIKTELERMNNLVNQFVMMGKPTISQRKTGNLTALIAETVQLMNSNAHLYNVEIHFRPLVRDLTIYMDASQIKQVLINFIKNAIEAMPEGGQIWIGLKENRTNITISVEDEGEGMTKDEVNQLGTPFFSTKGSGLGIGLSICYDIIKSHQGKVSIKSEKGNGTEIKLDLPYEREEN
ncbi:ATP-binding protein [Pseudalkalibacillus hwajinpoensis]|uniref:ATP-binding protein n=1 Tax=Guptibacillus hwajinpoensis TaxID=208199 RepID=UPI00325A57BA